MGELLKKFYNYIKDYQGTLVNAAVIAITGGVEQLTTFAAYQCPCVSPQQVKAIMPTNCSSLNDTKTGSAACSQLLNYGYGLSFIIAPAIGLLIFGMATNIRLWKTVTGFYHKQEKRNWHEIFESKLSIILQAMIFPLTWVSIAFLDGKFLACALTPMPYDVGPVKDKHVYENCEKVAKAAATASMSDAFLDNRGYSQVIGWIIVAASLVLGFSMYLIAKCIFPLTYYHAKYYKMYRSTEEAQMDSQLKEKAKLEATKNVKRFVESRRSKETWDKVSTVYEFHRNKENHALYSNLHEWALKQQDSIDRCCAIENEVGCGCEDDQHNNVSLLISNTKV